MSGDYPVRKQCDYCFRYYDASRQGIYDTFLFHNFCSHDCHALYYNQHDPRTRGNRSFWR